MAFDVPQIADDWDKDEDKEDYSTVDVSDCVVDPEEEKEGTPAGVQDNADSPMWLIGQLMNALGVDPKQFGEKDFGEISDAREKSISFLEGYMASEEARKKWNDLARTVKTKEGTKRASSLKNLEE